MLTKAAQYLRCHRGQSMVEFALVVPVLLFLLFGIMESGRVLYQMIIVTEAAREGARIAVVNANNSGVAQLVDTAVNNFGPGLTTTITYSNPVSGPVAGGTTTVTVTAAVTIVTPLFSAIFQPNPYPVAGVASMRVE